jgi:hypothetical protein
MLSQFHGQTRIVDIGFGEDLEALSAICTLAARTAAELPETCEIVAGFTCEQIQKSFSQMGFKSRRLERVFCHDPRKRIGPGRTIHLSMLDGDLCFFGNSDRPYLS